MSDNYMAMSDREESEVFADLGALCRRPGFIHVVAGFCLRDNLVPYKKDLTPRAMAKLYSMDRLIRTEISTLLGLLVQGEIDYTRPSDKQLSEWSAQAEALLEELHEVLKRPMLESLNPKNMAENPAPQKAGEFLREPIFYGGESAFSFQYRDLAAVRHAADDQWLLANMGFRSEDARAVLKALGKFQDLNMPKVIEGLAKLPAEQRTLLPAFQFTISELSKYSGIEGELILNVISAFSFNPASRNSAFTSLQEYNETNAYPVLKTGETSFLLFQYYSIVESFYESPFFWMKDDATYSSTAMDNRGRFAEQFSRERLVRVFGSDKVHTNINIFLGKSHLGEIDTLVLFGDRAIVIQAKAKKLTVASRKGNDGQIQKDFQGAVQDAYDQGLICARLMLENTARFEHPNSDPLEIPERINKVYICPLLSENYPALLFQSQQFLNATVDPHIPYPLVLDVFALDALTEMLPSPLHFICYLERRAMYAGRMHATHEIGILGFHLRNNLWLEGDTDFLWMMDDVSIDLEIAMTVRREGLPGKDTPGGILTRTRGTAVARIIQEIETNPDPDFIEIGLFLLSLSEETVKQISDGILQIAQRTRSDGRAHDFSCPLKDGDAGITFHCNSYPADMARSQLMSHCQRRKQVGGVSTWHGLCLRPDNCLPRLGLRLSYPWSPGPAQTASALGIPFRRPTIVSPDSGGRPKKVGRNDPCPCGSKRKYKHCCLR